MAGYLRLSKKPENSFIGKEGSYEKPRKGVLIKKVLN